MFVGCTATGSPSDQPVDDLSDWIRSLKIPLGDIRLDGSTGTTDITNMVVSDVTLPAISVDRTGPTSLKIGVSQVRLLVHIDRVVNTDPTSFLRMLLGMRTLELRNVEATLSGSFRAHVDVQLKKPSLVNFTDCEAHSHVSSLQDAKTQVGWLYAVDGSGQIGKAIDDQIKDEIASEFRELICKPDGLSETLEEMLDNYISEAEELRHNNTLRNDRTPALQQPYQWHNAILYRWLQKFIEHSDENKFSIHTLLKSFVSSAAPDHKICLVGSSVGVPCPFPAPKSTNLYVALDMSAGNTLTLRLENLTVLLSEANISSLEIPSANDAHPNWLGIKFAAGPLRFAVMVDVEIDSVASGSHSSLRKTMIMNIDVSRIFLEMYVVYEVDAAAYEALTPVQRVNSACLDRISNQFRIMYHNQSLRFRNVSVEIEQEEHGAEMGDSELRLMSSVERLVNDVLVSGINANPDKLHEFIKSFATPQLETLINTQGGFTGLLRGLGVPYGDSCPDPRETLLFFVLKCSAFVAGIMALFCVLVLRWSRRERSHGVCLARKRTTGIHWAFALPLLVVVSALLFIMSNTMDAAAMNLYLLWDETDPAVVSSLKTFSIFGSILELWNADMRFLATLIFLFSMILPYAKLMISLIVLWGPISTRGHGQILRFLDAIGKWSLLDAFVLMAIVSLASMRIPLRGGLGLAMYVEPQVGFLAFLTGTVLCLIIGNILLTLHRRAYRAEILIPPLPPAMRFNRCCGNPISALHHFIGAFIFALAFIWKGSQMSFCRIEVEGLVGWFLNYVHNVAQEADHKNSVNTTGNTFDFSVLSLGTRMRSVTTNSQPWQTFGLQVTYFGFALLIPSLFLLVGMGLSLRALCAGGRAMTWSGLHRMQTLGHTLYSWSAIDVYVIGVMLTVVEFGMGDQDFFTASEGLGEWIGQALKPEIEIPGDANAIFALTTTLHAGAFLMLLAAAILLIFGSRLLRSLAWLQQYESHYQQRLPDDSQDENPLADESDASCETGSESWE